MDKPTITNIRKITMGTDPKDGMAIEVGKTHHTPEGLIKIVAIVRNEESYYFWGDIIYQVFAQKIGEKTTFIWKHIEGIPVVVESFIP